MIDTMGFAGVTRRSVRQSSMAETWAFLSTELCCVRCGNTFYPLRLSFPMKCPCCHSRRWKSFDPDADYLVAGTSCWLWIKGTCALYGSTRSNGRQTPAHRVYYERFHGPIPNGFVVDHTCKNHLCVNPDHLEAVPMSVNTARGSFTSNKPDWFCNTWDTDETGRPLVSIQRNHDDDKFQATVSYI